MAPPDLITSWHLKRESSRAATASMRAGHRPPASRRCRRGVSGAGQSAGPARFTATRRIRTLPPAMASRWSAARRLPRRQHEFIQFHLTCLYHSAGAQLPRHRGAAREGRLKLPGRHRQGVGAGATTSAPSWRRADTVCRAIGLREARQQYGWAYNVLLDAGCTSGEAFQRAPRPSAARCLSLASTSPCSADSRGAGGRGHNLRRAW